MHYRRLLCSFIISLFSFIACNSNRYRPEEAHLSNPRPFIIAVVGNGVPGSTPPSKRILPKDRANGLAMWIGAEAAYNESERLHPVRKFIELQAHDDGANPGDADRIAKELEVNPRVLAVIGHATSASTRAAAWRYEQAGIPFLMPIATSPYAAMPLGKNYNSIYRLHNCFRLLPSDDRVQAPAVAFVASQKLLAKRCYLLGDFSQDIKEYSAPLYDELEIMLDNINILAYKRKFDPNSAGFQEVATSIRAQKTDLLVFCGYGTTAQELLDALRKTYQDVELIKRPKVLLTDGCKVNNLDTSGFSVYLTFPLPDILNSSIPPTPGASNSDFNILLNAIKKQGQQSYQMYAYDAMLMIGYALEKCISSEITRSCIQQELNNLQNFAGSYLGYSFVEGENTLSRYYLYSAIPNDQSVSPPFLLESTIQPEDIAKFFALTRGK